MRGGLSLSYHPNPSLARPSPHPLIKEFTYGGAKGVDRVNSITTVNGYEGKGKVWWTEGQVEERRAGKGKK